MIDELQMYFGDLFEAPLLQEINQVGTLKEIPAGYKLIDLGDFVRSMPLLVSGAIKIMRDDDDGDELLLYFLETGDTCAMTLSCCIGQTKSEIKAIAEMDTKLIMIPIQKMEEWTGKYKSWRNFVFRSYHQRLEELLRTIDSIAFMNMDQRLIQYLKNKVQIQKDSVVRNTHQEIAYELHSSRVVISRLLKKLEKLGKIELHRNSIKVLSL